MTSKTIDIKTPDGVCDSYISCPNAGGPFAAVLFYMDGIGIRPVLREMADRLAANGFYVLLPNMFYRSGRAAPVDVAEVLKPENRASLMDLVKSLTPERVLRDAGVFLDFLGAQKEVTPGGRVGLPLAQIGLAQNDGSALPELCSYCAVAGHLLARILDFDPSSNTGH